MAGNAKQALDYPLPQLAAEDLTTAVERHLRDSILAGRLVPDQMISTRSLADAFGISMTPVRNALDRLAKDGIVVMNPRQGARVKALTRRDIEECFDLRLELEGYATEQMARRYTEEHRVELERRWALFGAKLQPDGATAATGERPAEWVRDLGDLDRFFHQYIIESSGNQRLPHLYAILELSLAVGRMYFLGHGPLAGHTSHHQHRMIIEALTTGDPKLARETAEFHVRQSRDGMLAAFPSAG